jgi:putative transposase
VSERRACGLTGLCRSMLRHRERASQDEVLSQRLAELARECSRFGYRRLHVLLRREGRRVNHKRVLRLYRLAGHGQRRQKRKRMPSLVGGRAQLPSQPNGCWTLDFVSNTLAWGWRIAA